ncbi:MAG: Lipoprotein LpqB, GerMN domain [Frankiales bacterium]|nr:Lipoprotein LpqB, GerMN domain [Frankiales bacterium]
MRRAGGLLVAAALLVACGLPPDAEPRALDSAEAPAGALPSASPLPEAVGDERVTLWFVQGGRVVPVTRPVAARTSTTALLGLLLDGPTPAEQQAGATSLIPTSLSVAGAETQGDTVLVTLRGTRDQLRPQALAFAQIVATLTPERAAGVRFRLDGADLPVPRSDGLLISGPVSRSAYADLLGDLPVAPRSAPAAAGPAPSPPAG